MANQEPIRPHVPAGNVAAALDRVENTGESYEAGAPQVRRAINRSLFENVKIRRDGSATAKLSDDVELLVHDDVQQAARQHAEARAQQEVLDIEETMRAAALLRNERTLAFCRTGFERRLVGGRRGTRTPDIFLVREAL